MDGTAGPNLLVATQGPSATHFVEIGLVVSVEKVLKESGKKYA